MPTVPSTPHTGRRIKIFINDKHYDAPEPNMTGRELLQLADLPETNQLFLEVPGPNDDRPVGVDEPIELRPDHYEGVTSSRHAARGRTCDKRSG